MLESLCATAHNTACYPSRSLSRGMEEVAVGGEGEGVQTSSGGIISTWPVRCARPVSHAGCPLSARRRGPEDVNEVWMGKAEVRRR